MTKTATHTDPNLEKLCGEDLLPVGPELAEAVNRRVGIQITTGGALYDAARIGTKTRNGGRVLLEAIRAGKRRYSSVAAVIRWTRAVAIADAEGLR